MTPEANMKLAVLRQRIAQDPNSLTQEELREALNIMRDARGQAASAAPRAGSRAKKAPVSSDDLLKELEGS